MCAYRREEYAGLTPAEAMRKEAIRMREDIAGSLKNGGKWSF
jgi:hypothetical protein